MRNELHALVSVDLTVPALMDVQSMRRSELSMRLQLLLPATASAVPALERGKETFAPEEGEARLQVLPAEHEDDVQV